jgi:hypothetical protein
LDASIPNYSLVVLRLISSMLTFNPGEWSTSSWLVQDILRSKKGSLSLYMTDTYKMLLFGTQPTANGHNKYYCYSCRHSNGCTHSSEIHQNPNELLDYISSPATRTYNYYSIMISSQRYPFKCNMDPDLSNHVKYRLNIGVKSWLDQNLTECCFLAETTECCNYPCTLTATCINNVHVSKY